MKRYFKSLAAIFLAAILSLALVMPAPVRAAQQDFDITTADANTGVAMRAAINAGLQALASNNSGATEPATPYAYMFWADTANDLLKIRNAANSGWVTVCQLSAATATSAQVLAGASATNLVTPSVLNAELVKNLKFVVNGSVNKLDIFTKSGGAVPSASNIITVAIPDGTGNTFRSRAAAYLSGTSQFIMADAANYWSKGSLAGEIKNAYIYAIWDANGGIVWALSGYSGFTRVPASTTATDDDFFLLEADSTYTKVITDYCVCVGKIRYSYVVADTPDHTIQATVLDAPQVVWNPRSDYTKTVLLATTNTSGSDITEYSVVSIVAKQGGRFLVSIAIHGIEATTAFNFYGFIKYGSATYASAVYAWKTVTQFAAGQAELSRTYPVKLNAGDTIHLGTALTSSSGNRIIAGDDYVGGIFLNATALTIQRVD